MDVIKHFAKKERRFQILLNKWEKVKEMHNILQILYEATNQSQRADMTLSDFYGCWLLAKIQLENFQEHHTNLARQMLHAMNRREKILIDNDTMVSAVFLDPRYSSELTESQIERAKANLVNCWCNLKSTVTQNNVNQNERTNTKRDFLEEHFLNKGLEPIINNDVKESTGPDFSKAGIDILRLLDKYYAESIRLHHSESILQFWENKASTHPELYIIACIFNSIPPCQTTVERAFSALNCIFTNRRYKIKQSMLEDILTIKLNDCIKEIICIQDRNLINKP